MFGAVAQETVHVAVIWSEWKEAGLEAGVHLLYVTEAAAHRRNDEEPETHHIR